MYYLKHEQGCFIRYKDFVSNKTRQASVLNGFLILHNKAKSLYKNLYLKIFI